MVDTGAGENKIKDDARCDAGDVSVGVLETWDKLFAAFEEIASSVTSVCYRHFGMMKVQMGKKREKRIEVEEEGLRGRNGS